MSALTVAAWRWWDVVSFLVLCVLPLGGLIQTWCCKHETPILEYECQEIA